MDMATETKESEYIKRSKKLELALKEIHAIALNYAAAVRGDLPNEMRFKWIAKQCLMGIQGKK